MRLTLSIATYAAAIVAANVMTANLGLVPVGFGLLVTAGTFAAGFALLARDFVQRHGGIPWSIASVALGGLLSWFLASPELAVASTVAFVAAELVDLVVFTPLRRRSFVLAALTSNVVSAPIDTALFLHLAGFGVTWQAVTGQFIGKTLWATVVPIVFYLIAKRAVLREPLN